MSMFKFSLSVIFSPWILQEASSRLRAYGNFSESLSTEVLKSDSPQVKQLAVASAAA